VQCAAIRYVQADLFPCAIIYWNADGYRWKHISDSMWKAKLRKTIKSSAQLPLDSATAEARNSKDNPTQGYRQRGSTVSSWFPFVDSSWNRNAILVEQAIHLGRYGTLTFIYPDNPL